jgi:uncharacterized protein YqgV (UPF0045/DUF77 family)
MKVQLNLVYQAALVAVVMMTTACNKSSSTPAAEEAPADIESAYLSLSAELQKEIFGAEVMPVADVRKELLAKADKDGDGLLSEEEKAALKAEWKEMKEKLRAEMKAALDKDQDGEVSAEEKKAGLEAMGQQIKASIQSTLEEIRAAQEEARAKIKAACSKSDGAGKPEAEPAALKEGAGRSADAGPADDLDAESMNKEIEKELNACQTVVQAEKDNMHEMLKAALEALHAELDELKGKLGTVEEVQGA